MLETKTIWLVELLYTSRVIWYLFMPKNIIKYNSLKYIHNYFILDKLFKKLKQIGIIMKMVSKILYKTFGEKLRLLKISKKCEQSFYEFSHIWTLFQLDQVNIQLKFMLGLPTYLPT